MKQRGKTITLPSGIEVTHRLLGMRETDMVQRQIKEAEENGTLIDVAGRLAASILIGCEGEIDMTMADFFTLLASATGGDELNRLTQSFRDNKK